MLDRLSVKTKLAFVCGILILLTVVVVITGLLMFNDIKQYADIRFQITIMSESYIGEVSAFRAYLFNGDSKFIEEHNQNNEKLHNILSGLKTNVNNPKILSLLNQFELLESKWKEISTDFIEKRKQVDAGLLSMQDLTTDFNNSSGPQLVREVDALDEKIKDETTSLIESTSQLPYVIMYSVLAVSLAIGVILTLLISRSIATPLRKLQEVVEVTSKGDLTSKIEINRSDEIGQLVTAFKRMTSSLTELVGRVVGTASDVSTVTQQISTSTEQMNASVQQVTGTVQQIAKSSQSQARSTEEINQSIEKLNQNMKELERKAQVTSESSQQVRKIAENGERSANEATDTITKMTRISEETRERIKSLVERSSQITSILGVIRKIADQTNLLALNAAIEAARAGESGKGFAVVADEVRRLAENSAKAVEDIDKQIQQIQEEAKITVNGIEEGNKQVVAGRETIIQSLENLKEISTTVQETVRSITSINSLVKDQVLTVEEIRNSTYKIASSAEENASGTEETATAMEEHSAGMEEIASATLNLNDLSEQLLDLIKTFKIPQQSEIIAPIQLMHKTVLPKKTKSTQIIHSKTGV